MCTNTPAEISKIFHFSHILSEKTGNGSPDSRFLKSLWGVHSSKDINGQPVSQCPIQANILMGISRIKIELAFVLCLLFGILQDSLTTSTSEQFLSFIQKVCGSHFCICAMCFEQVRFQCWSCKLRVTVNTSEAFVAQSASTFFFKQHFTIDTIVFCAFTIAMKNIHVLPFSGTGKNNQHFVFSDTICCLAVGISTACSWLALAEVPTTPELSGCTISTNSGSDSEEGWDEDEGLFLLNLFRVDFI